MAVIFAKPWVGGGPLNVKADRISTVLLKTHCHDVPWLTVLLETCVNRFILKLSE